MVIPKSEKDQLSPKSYRSISLLNVDFKSFTSSLAYCLNTLIGEFIFQDKVGFIPNRDMRDNTTKVLYLFSYCIRTQQTATALAIDIEKGFDTLEILYLKAVLQQMGCGPYFLNIIGAIFTNPEARLCINKIQSNTINLQRGTRPGYPLSSILFAIGIEPLAIAILAQEKKYRCFTRRNI